MAGVPVRLSCTCGHVGTWVAETGQAWVCPACARCWAPDTTAIDVVTRGANDLARLRHLVLGLVLGAVVVAAVLVAIHPAWALGAPLLVGGALLAFRPTYKKRRQRALASVRSGIRLTAARA